MERKAYLFIAGFLLVSTLNGCNTVSGALKDVADTARNIRDIINVGQDIEDLSN